MGFPVDMAPALIEYFEGNTHTLQEEISTLTEL